MGLVYGTPAHSKVWSKKMNKQGQLYPPSGDYDSGLSDQDSFSHSARPWLHVRLTGSDLPALRIAEDWRYNYQLAAKIQESILLVDALDRGDRDAVLKIRPDLANWTPGTGLPTPPLDPPVLDPQSRSSEEIRIPEGNTESSSPESRMSDAVSRATCTDPVANGGKLRYTVRLLMKAGYRPEEIDDWYIRVWKANDWRGIKGDCPSLPNLRETILQVRRLPPLPDPVVPGDQQVAPEAAHPYLSDPYFEVRDEVDPADLFPAPPPAAPLPRRAENWWIALLGSLKLSLAPATFATHLGHAVLVEVQEGEEVDTFTATVPNSYVREWNDRHLRPLMECQLSDLYLKPVSIVFRSDS